VAVAVAVLVMISYLFELQDFEKVSYNYFVLYATKVAYNQEIKYKQDKYLLVPKNLHYKVCVLMMRTLRYFGKYYLPRLTANGRHKEVQYDYCPPQKYMDRLPESPADEPTLKMANVLNESIQLSALNHLHIVGCVRFQKVQSYFAAVQLFQHSFFQD
jgi:ferredoxin-NADP reductase